MNTKQFTKRQAEVFDQLREDPFDWNPLSKADLGICRKLSKFGLVEYEIFGRKCKVLKDLVGNFRLTDEGIEVLVREGALRKADFIYGEIYARKYRFDNRGMCHERHERHHKRMVRLKRVFLDLAEY